MSVRQRPPAASSTLTLPGRGGASKSPAKPKRVELGKTKHNQRAALHDADSVLVESGHVSDGQSIVHDMVTLIVGKAATELYTHYVTDIAEQKTAAATVDSVVSAVEWQLLTPDRGEFNVTRLLNSLFSAKSDKKQPATGAAAGAAAGDTKSDAAPSAGAGGAASVTSFGSPVSTRRSSASTAGTGTGTGAAATTSTAATAVSTFGSPVAATGFPLAVAGSPPPALLTAAPARVKPMGSPAAAAQMLAEAEQRVLDEHARTALAAQNARDAAEHERIVRWVTEHSTNPPPAPHYSQQSYADDDPIHGGTNWVAEAEPLPCQIDAWARGVVPVKRRTSPASTPTGANAINFSSAAGGAAGAHRHLLSITSTGSGGEPLSARGGAGKGSAAPGSPFNRKNKSGPPPAAGAKFLNSGYDSGRTTAAAAAGASPGPRSGNLSARSTGPPSPSNAAGGSFSGTSTPAGGGSAVAGSPHRREASRAAFGSRMSSAGSTGSGGTGTGMVGTNLQNLPIPVEQVRTDDDIERENLRITELRKMERKKREHEKAAAMRAAQREEEEKYDKIRDELKGKQYTFDERGNVIVIQPLRPEQMPTLSHVPRVHVKDPEKEEDEKTRKMRMRQRLSQAKLDRKKAEIETRKENIEKRGAGAGGDKRKGGKKKSDASGDGGGGDAEDSDAEELTEEQKAANAEKKRKEDARLAAAEKRRKQKQKTGAAAAAAAAAAAKAKSGGKDDFVAGGYGGVSQNVAANIALAAGVTLRDGGTVKTSADSRENSTFLAIKNGTLTKGMTKTQFLQMLDVRHSAAASLGLAATNDANGKPIPAATTAATSAAATAKAGVAAAVAATLATVLPAVPTATKQPAAAAGAAAAATAASAAAAAKSIAGGGGGDDSDGGGAGMKDVIGHRRRGSFALLRSKAAPTSAMFDVVSAANANAANTSSTPDFDTLIKSDPNWGANPSQPKRYRATGIPAKAKVAPPPVAIALAKSGLITQSFNASISSLSTLPHKSKRGGAIIKPNAGPNASPTAASDPVAAHNRSQSLLLSRTQPIRVVSDALDLTVERTHLPPPRLGQKTVPGWRAAAAAAATTASTATDGTDAPEATGQPAGSVSPPQKYNRNFVSPNRVPAGGAVTATDKAKLFFRSSAPASRVTTAPNAARRPPQQRQPNADADANTRAAAADDDGGDDDPADASADDTRGGGSPPLDAGGDDGGDGDGGDDDLGNEMQPAATTNAASAAAPSGVRSILRAPGAGARSGPASAAAVTINRTTESAVVSAGGGGGDEDDDDGDDFQL